MKKIITILALLFSADSAAVWLNTKAKITNIITYSSRNTILVQLEAEGAKVPECSNSNTFAISSTLDPEARARMYSTLLAARSADRPVIVSYNDAGGCEPWGNTSNVYRRIVRLYY